MVSCNHKKRICDICGSCPRCPQCTCNGHGRGRGRPRKVQSRTHRSSAAVALQNIKDGAIFERDNVEQGYEADKSSTKVADTPFSLLGVLGIPRWVIRYVPKSDKRVSTFSDLDMKEREGLHQVLEICLSYISNILLPADAQLLKRSFMEENIMDSKIRGALVDGVKSSRKGSIEKRTLMALLCATTRAEDVQALIHDNHGALNGFELSADIDDDTSSKKCSAEMVTGEAYKELEPVDNNQTTGLPAHNSSTTNPFSCHVRGCVLDAPGNVATARSHNCSICNSAVHSLCCQRILGIQVQDSDTPLYCSKCFDRRRNVTTLSERRGCEYNGADTPEIETVTPPQCGRSDARDNSRKRKRLSCENTSRVVRRKLSGAAGMQFQKSRKDWDFLLSVGNVVESRRMLRRCSDLTIKEALKFLFRPEHIQLLSWGTKRVRVDGKWENFPAVVRRFTCERLFREYERSFQRKVTTEDSSKLLRRTSFLQLARTFTRGAQKRKAAVDYVLGTLVYDTIRTVRDIVTNEVEGSNQQKFLDQLCAVEEFLKFVYLEHIGVDEDAFHDPDFALSKRYSSSDDCVKHSACKTCLTPFQILKDIQSNLKAQRQDIIAALDSTKHNFLLYMGHQHRCLNQEKRIAEVFPNVKNDQASQSVVVLVDYKMKFEAIRFREKTTEFFGKKGMSWHGAVIFYRALNDLGTSVAHAVGPSEQIRSKPSPKEAELSTLFFDHILSNDMSQDRVAVCSILDAILSRLKLELPHVTNFYLLSDNARCYQNDLLPVMAPQIAKCHRLSINGFLHPETQRGKSLVDAHFAIAMKHVSRYCNETRKDVTTPSDVVEALNSFGGVANCTAEMIHIRRTHLPLRQWIIAQDEGKLSKLGRINEFIYDKLANCGDKWIVKCYALSGREFIDYEFGEHYSKHLSGRSQKQVNNPEGDDQDNEEHIETDTHLQFVNPEEIAYQGNITGVTMWSRSRLRRMKRRRKIKVQNAIEDTEKEITSSQNKDAESSDEENTSSSEEDAVMLRCEKCQKPYRRQQALLVHQVICKGEKQSVKVLDRAGQIAREMLGTQDAAIYTTKEKHPSTLTLEVNADTIQSCVLSFGWAQRPAYGKTLGENYTKRYQCELTEWFETGEMDKGKKLSASRMRELLKLKYPGRYDIPGEHSITAFISAMVRKQKTSTCNGKDNSETRNRRGIPIHYAEMLGAMLDKEPNLMPRHARSALISALELNEGTLPEDFPAEASIKSKLSSLKSQRKRR